MLVVDDLLACVLDKHVFAQSSRMHVSDVLEVKILFENDREGVWHDLDVGDSEQDDSRGV